MSNYDITLYPKKNSINLPKSYIIWFVIMAIVSVVSFQSNFVNNNLIFVLKYATIIIFTISLLILKRSQFKELKYVHLIALFIIALVSIPNLFITNGVGLASSVIYILIALAIAALTMMLFPKIKQEQFNSLLWALLAVIAVFVIADSLIQSVNPFAYYTIGDRYRFIGSFQNPNELSRFALLGILISLRLLAINKNIFVNIFLLVMIGAGFYIIHLTDSRSAMLIGLLSLFLYFVSLIFIKTRLKMFIALFIFGTSILIFILNYVFSNLASTIDLNYLSSGRIEIWTMMVNSMDAVTFLFGNGAVREGLSAQAIIVNGYFEILHYLGFVGLLVWLGFILIMLIKKAKVSLKKPTLPNLIGINIVILFLAYYVFEGGLLSLGNIASIYFWIELAQREN